MIHYEIEIKTTRKDWTRLARHYPTAPEAMRDINRRVRSAKQFQYIQHFTAAPPTYRLIEIVSQRVEVQI